MERLELEIGKSILSLETGKLAKQADGAVVVRYGDTVVLVTAVASKEAEEGLDFFPLTVEYRERAYAAGRIPDIYGRREPRPGTGEILIARLIDHCIRPLFPKDARNEIQIMALTLASDKENPPDTLAVIGASAALCVSDIPFIEPVGAVIVGKIDGEFIINPTYEEEREGELDLFVTGTKSAVMSVEGGAKILPESEILEAIDFAHQEIKKIVELQEKLTKLCGKPKREFVKVEANEEVEERLRAAATEGIVRSIGIIDKLEREQYLKDLKHDVAAPLEDENVSEDVIDFVMTKIEKEEMRRSILTEGKRIDGRGLKDIRPITCEVGVLPRTHGSALFTRGQTQALCVTTLGISSDEEEIKDLEGKKTKRFMLHYNFPPFSVGEVAPIRGPGRREIGHGALAERALTPVMPDEDEFPYAVRVVAEILESNASSSMASVCGATLALMDAGVPIKAPVAGVGIGLVKEGDQFAILTDMIGVEDALGDMDFKIAGTKDGITAIQMDIKISGVSREIMELAMIQAKEARAFIIDKMLEAIPEPRPEISIYAPRIISLKIPVDKIKDVIGPGGRVIKKMQDELGVQIEIENDGTVQIASTDKEAADKAISTIRSLTEEPEIGKIYTGKVTSVTDYGAFVEIFAGREGLLHISELNDGYVRKVEDVLSEGDEVVVKLIDIDKFGRLNLSRKAVISETKKLHNTQPRKSLRLPKGKRH
ncbi:TPA: polyribonucleotide nucleotidyltransferase [Candidatus Poribacteria bacterium]|nr:polyribonucleotide nucleotidyltransferase [Candidatus Poribacteria bacterium]